MLAFGGYFYWDDLILIGKAGTEGLLSPSYLFDDHDGHVMPAAFLVAGAITRLAPLVWTGPAISLVVLQLLASLSLLRALHVILGWRPVLLIPLTFALFTPLAVPGFAWWAAALNSLPMLAALAWVCADAILLVRTGNQRYAVTGVLAYLGGLLFFEKAAVIPFVAFAVVALLCHVQGGADPGSALRTAWRGGARLWIASLALTAGWVALYLAVVNQRRWSSDLAMTWDLLSRSITHGIVPGLAGGPWHWARWAPASPWATPPPLVMALGWLVLLGRAGAVADPQTTHRPGVADRRRVRGRLPGADLSDALVAVHRTRIGPNPTVFPGSRRGAGAVGRRRLHRAQPAIFRSARCFAATCCGDDVFGGVVPGQQPVLDGDVSDQLARQPRPALPAERPRQFGCRACKFGCAVAGSRGRSAGAATGGRGRRTWPATCSPCCAIVPNSTRPQRNCGCWTAPGTWSTLASLGSRTIVPGPMPRCGYFAQPDQPARMVLDGPLLPADWTVELNYLANSDGSMTLSLSEGPTQKVPVHPGLNRVYARLPGAGDAITVRANTTALALCLASGPVGFLAPA